MKYILLVIILCMMPLLPIWLNKMAAMMRDSKRQTVREKTQVDEALQTLALPNNPTEEQIKAAHKRLIQKNHPDAGGSIDAAATINEARDILLKSQKER